MAYVTLGQLDERLTAIDDLLLKADLGELSIDSTEREVLNVEAEAILKTLAKEIGKRQNIDAKEVYLTRSKVRKLDYLAAVMEKYQATHPEPNPENDRVIAEFFSGVDDGSKTQKDAAAQVALIFSRAFPGLAGEAHGVETRVQKKRTRWLTVFVTGMIAVAVLLLVILTR